MTDISNMARGGSRTRQNQMFPGQNPVGPAPSAPIAQFSGSMTQSNSIKALRTELGLLVTDMGKLDKAIQSINEHLEQTANNFGNLTGKGGGNGPGGKGNSSAPISAVAFGVGAEFAAQTAGGINSYLSGVKSPGAATRVTAAQVSTSFGGNTGASVVSAVNQYAKIRNLSSSDLVQALGTLTGNALLRVNPNSKSQGNLKNVMNSLTGLNPVLGAGGAASFLNTLASGPALNMFNQKLGGSQGVLVQPGPGGKDTINTPQQVFSRLIKALTGGQVSSPSQMKKWASTPGQMAIMQQNASAIGISPTDFMLIQQVMAKGGNVQQAVNQMQKVGAPAATAAQTASTQATATGLTVYDQSQAAQKTLSSIDAGIQRLVQLISGKSSLLSDIGIGGAGAVSKGLSGVSQVGGLMAIGKLLGGGGAAAGEGAATAGLLSRLLKSSAGKGLGIGVAGNLVGAGIKGNAPSTGARGRVGAAVSDAATAAMLGMMLPIPGADAVVAGVGGLLGGAFGAITGMGDPGLSPDMSRKVAAMRAVNPSIKVNSGRRSKAQQALLYALKGGRGVAKPGQSRHEHGLAADIGPPSQMGWLMKNANRFGLYHPAAGSEPWHVESMGDPMTPTSFSQDLLKKLGIHPSSVDVSNLAKWQAGEGQWGASGGFNAANMYDPLNTKLTTGAGTGGAPIGGGATVAYKNWNQGIAATAQTMQQSNMAPLVKALKANASPSNFYRAILASSWGGSGRTSLYGGSLPGSPAVAVPMGPGSAISTPTVGGGGGPSSSSSSSSGPSINRLLSLLGHSGGTGLSNDFLQQVSSNSWLHSLAGGGGGTSSNALLAKVRSLSSNSGTQAELLAGALLGSGESINPSALRSMMGDPAPVITAMPMSGSAGSWFHGARVTVNLQMAPGSGTSMDDARQFTKNVKTALEEMAQEKMMAGK